MKSFRDPVHDLIAFTDEDQLAVDLINTKEVQRLRRIRQLGLSNIAYPGAEHSRFVHSLGVAHLLRRFLDAPARRFADAAGANVGEFRHLALAAGLLHDVGHGPFSHALEAITGERHEQWTTALLRSPGTEIHQVLEARESGLSEQVASVIERRFKPSRALVKLLSSQLDMDRTDYLLRDALMTGAGYGSFDVEWLLHTMRIGEADGDTEVGLDLEKGRSIAEDYIMCRYYMYLHVYFHRTTRAAEVLVEMMMRRAQEVKARLPGLEALNSLLAGRLRADEEACVPHYLELDDAILWTATHLWARHEDPVLADLADRLLNRRVYRSVDVAGQDEEDRWLDALRDRARHAGVPARYYVIADTAESHAYRDSYLTPFAAGGERGGASETIFLFDGGGAAHDLSDVSFIVSAVRNKRASVRRVMCPGEWLADA